MKLKAVVFDLDDTLLDTTRILVPIAKTPEFHKRIREPLPLIEGAKENLKYLSSKYDLYLLTMGDIENQKAKIKSLNIQSYFRSIYIANPQIKETKYIKFQQLIVENKYKPSEFISIGNRRSTDIRDAKKSGGLTCLFKYGEHLDELAECSEDIPDYEIQHHNELLKVCSL